ncbi:MAG: ABC transporter permease [Nanoarchaeota archaeon]
MRPSNVFKIARLELKKSRSRVEKKVIIIMAVLGLLIYASVTLFMQLGILGTEQYYTFYTNDETIHEILLATEKFIPSQDAEADLFIDTTSDGTYVFAKNSDRAQAAVTVLERAIKEYNTMIYSSYDPALAYPLRIRIEEIEQDEDELEKMIQESIAIEQDVAETQSGENPEAREEDADTQADGVTDDAALQPQDELSEQAVEEMSDASPEPAPASPASPSDDVRLPPANLTEGATEGEYRLMQDVNPYSQFNVLFIVVLMTMPLSMVALIFSNSIMAEKINKRGIFLLLAPILKSEWIIGKTLLYFIGSFVGLLFVVGRHVDSFLDGFYASLILAAIILTYLAIGFIVAMFSRSHKELSFLGIFSISLYSCYLLIPAFMLNFSVISLASPLTIIAKLFQGEIVTLKLFLFSVLPTLVSGLCIFLFGSLLLNDQNMFTYRNISAKIIDGISQLVRKGKYMLSVISFASIPFIFLIQLMMIVFLLSLRSWLSIYILMFFGALVEETFKNVGIYTIITRKLGKTDVKHIAWYSLLTGLGFFIGEKVLLLIMIAPFMEAYLTLVLAGVVLPLLLHTSLSFVFGLSARFFGKKNFGTSVMLVTILHFIINFVISFLARGGAM